MPVSDKFPISEEMEGYRFHKEIIEIAKQHGVRVGAVDIEPEIYGGDPVAFVNGQYAGYLFEYFEDWRDGLI